MGSKKKASKRPAKKQPRKNPRKKSVKTQKNPPEVEKCNQIARECGIKIQA